MFNRRASVGNYTVEKTGRETARIASPNASVLVALETLADGKSVCIYPRNCILERAEDGLTIESYLGIAAEGLAEWIILTATEAFAFRADGFYASHASDTPPEKVEWLPLG